MKDTCPICLKPARVALLSGTTTLNVSCKVCGEYRISMPVAVSTELRQYEKRHILSSAVRNRFERNEKVEILKLTDIDSVLGISMAGSQVEATAQIFLSYAREDEGKVENLYQELSDAGFKPWMDRRDILPGEKWKSSIQKAIQHSDFFLACLSANSVSKRGYLQKEIKDALDIWQEMLDSDIYLIPARLEDCEVPESLRGFQWVNLFEENGWKRLSEAIQVGMERRAQVPTSKKPFSSARTVTPQKGAERPSARILYVEDDPVWQDIIRSTLVPPDFDLQIASSFAEAKLKLQGSFDLIIVNLCLANESDYSGVVLLDDLSESHVPRIVLTGSAIAVRGLFERYDVYEVFVKGAAFNRAQFLQTVKAAIEGYHSSV